MIREKITDLEDRQKRTEHSEVDVSEEENRKNGAKKITILRYSRGKEKLNT